MTEVMTHFHALPTSHAAPRPVGCCHMPVGQAALPVLNEHKSCGASGQARLPVLRVTANDYVIEIPMKSDVPVPVRCNKCGLMVQVPPGGKRLCGCGNWVAAENPVELADAPLTPGDLMQMPKIEGDLSAIERLNDGYRRITREMNKAIVGQQRVLEELLI